MVTTKIHFNTIFDSRPFGDQNGQMFDQRHILLIKPQNQALIYNNCIYVAMKTNYQMYNNIFQLPEDHQQNKTIYNKPDHVVIYDLINDQN